MQLRGSLLALALAVLVFPASAQAQADNPETICTNLRSNYPTEYGNLFLSSLPEEQQLAVLHRYGRHRAGAVHQRGTGRLGPRRSQ